MGEKKGEHSSAARKGKKRKSITRRKGEKTYITS